MKRLFLIDGHSLIFRMYYAFLRRPMINSKGEDTSILFGFSKFLLELVNKEHPTHIAVAFDPPAKTFRHEIYPEYKANRSAAPELVRAALDPLVEIVEALGIPVIMQPGYEADDVIGTIAQKYEKEGYTVYMVTPDKDLGQIVSDNIFQYKPGRSGSENEIVGREQICAQYGIDNPKEVIDILAIWGDASDNVKGVKGIGEVGAKKLVGKYGSLENILNHLDELPAKQQEAFKEAAPHLGMSKFLVTIKTDIDIDVNDESLKISMCCNQCISDLFNKYEFNSLRGMLPDGDITIQEPEHKHIDSNEISPSALLQIISSPSADTFAASGEEHSDVVSIRVDQNIILSCGNNFCKTDFEDPIVKQIIENDQLIKIGHSLKTEVEILKNHGINIKGELHDIELMHYLLNPERTHKLDILANGYLNADISRIGAVKEVETTQQFDLFSAPIPPSESDVSSKTATLKRINECIAISSIYPLMKAELIEQHLWDLYLKIEMPLIYVLSKMEEDGIKIDPGQLAEYGRTLSEELAVLESEIKEMAHDDNVNISSPRQIGIILYEKLNLNPKVKKSRQDNYPTDEETLLELADKHPIINKILEFRATKKLLSTYLDPLPSLINPKTGKIHTTFNQALTSTGRLSSVKPNLQNIPIRSERGREIRKAFVPSTPDGYIVSADYSQIELRIMAELSRDPGMIEGFINGADIHTATAAKIFKVEAADVTREQRRRAKVANFGIIYGISPFGLAQRLNIPRRESKEFIEEYFRHYPKIKEYMNSIISKAREQGYVETIFGRKRYLPDINSRNQVVRGLSERNAINAPIQGSAADIIKLAMINVFKRMQQEQVQSKMVLQVHDELVFDVVSSELDIITDIVKYEMENVYKLSIPLIVDCSYGKNWLEAH